MRFTFRVPNRRERSTCAQGGDRPPLQSCHIYQEFPMKPSRIVVVLVVVLTAVCLAAPARAEINTNFVKDFLQRYRPSKVTFSSPASAASPQQLADLIRSGQLPLTMGDLINLILQNNLDIGVNRLSPLSSQYLIDTLYRQFEPTLHLQATVNRNTTPATTVLAGAANPSTLGGAYTVGYAQNLATRSEEHT